MKILFSLFSNNSSNILKTVWPTLSLLCVFILLLSMISIENSQANPLTGKRTPAPQSKKVKTVPVPTVFSEVITKITILQMQIKQKIAASVHDFKKSGNITPLLPLFFLSFFYGGIHAAGPGHGKAIAMSYVLTQGKGYKSGVVLGTLIAIIHAASAIIVVFLLRYLFEKAISNNIESATQTTQIFSYGLICLIGVYILFTSVYSLIKGVGYNDDKDQGRKKFTNSLSAALAIGIIPCPGVIMILLFCLSLDQVALGIMLCIFVSIGMALTISISVWISIAGKKLTLFFTGKTEKGFFYTEHAFSCISGVLLSAMGGLFLAASLSL